MTGMGITGNLVAILVLLLVIGGTWLALRSRLGETANTVRRRRADKGKVRCQHRESVVGGAFLSCKTKAGWETTNGYFCDAHQEINSLRAGTRVRWANKLAWRRMENGV